MRNTKLIAVMSLMAGAFIAASYAPGEDARPVSQPPGGEPAPDPKMSYFLDCAAACHDCARVCNLCEAHCAKMLAAGHKEHLETIRSCGDCASICNAAAAVTGRSGPYSDLICAACADACKRCGDACAKHADHDPIMKQCMEECRKCEKVCRKMLKTTPKGETTPLPKK